MVELRRPVKSNGLVKPLDSLEEPAPEAQSIKESVEPAAPKAAKKPSLIAPRHKPKPAPKPPLSAEEWISRANADGPETSVIPKYLAVSLDAGSIARLESMAIQLSENKLAVLIRMIQDAAAHAEEIREFRKTFSDPPGPVQIRSFLVPTPVFIAANQLSKSLNIYGRSKVIRTLISYFSIHYFSD